MLGYKGFARCHKDGYVEKVLTHPANEADSPHFKAMVDGANTVHDSSPAFSLWRCFFPDFDSDFGFVQ